MTSVIIVSLGTSPSSTPRTSSGERSTATDSLVDFGFRRAWGCIGDPSHHIWTRRATYQGAYLPRAVVSAD